MTSSMSSYRVGFFVILGVTALIVAVFLVGSQEGLFHSTVHVTAYVNSVEGIRSGSAVRLAGVDIGVVDKVEVLPQENKVQIDLRLNTSARSFVKKDSYATIRPEGLVGNYFVDVTAGSPEGEQIEDGDVIRSKEALRLSAVMENTEEILENIRHASGELASTLTAINEGQGTLGKFIARDDIYNNLEHMSSRADAGVGKALGNVDTLSASVRNVVRRTDSLVANVNAVFTRLNEGGGTIGALLTERRMYDSLLVAAGNTVRATEGAKIGSRRFAEDMEALKHNWFFRGYFEDRGYWDEADYEKELDRKLDSLKALEAKVASQVEALERRDAMAPK